MRNSGHVVVCTFVKRRFNPKRGRSRSLARKGTSAAAAKRRRCQEDAQQRNSGLALPRLTHYLASNLQVIPTLTYGCEAWTLQARHKGQIEAAQMRALRRIEGVSRMDRVRNVDIRGRLKQEGVLDMVKKRQQNWKQKVEEMSNNRVTKKIYDGEIPGRRPRGRPRKRWSCNFD